MHRFTVHRFQRFLCAVRLPLTLAVITAAAACIHAAETPWGRIEEAGSAPSRHRFLVERWPADGRIVVPADFPQIVRATMLVDGDRRDVAVEYTEDASQVAILGPANAPASGLVDVETADTTAQCGDGRIALTARTAKVEGSQAKLEEQPGNFRIGFWSNPADVVAWTYQPTRWGAYDLRLAYSSASPPGTEIEVAIGETKLRGRLDSTGSWYRYTTLPLGRVVIPSTQPLAVAVRCLKSAGGAVMNLKAILLEPACEGRPPAQGDDGTILLHGRDATVRGTALRWEPAEKKQTLGFWTKPSDAAEWSFTVQRSGRFEVEVLQGCGRGQGGSEVAIVVDPSQAEAPQSLAFVVEDTGGFQEFRPRTIGRVTLGEGEHLLRVQPQRIAKVAACDIRQIRLLPVQDQP
jgi:hypothetical protein